ncbi:bifunctional DNA primase/polymerase [Iamia sp.]|uniref:bifunctional DNA primase/polymerase n=1 Tax=Iamia sp. TaxID=2722710 RepID=UPI002B555765|nr:bifunctional DNA primase/polymerase [Iamia sp.]HXH58451.1 bifunctional DNA primase/polymerase [Iamia sp.]
MTEAVAAAAAAAHQAGLCVIPAAADGTKAPSPGGRSWRAYQSERATPDQLARWFRPDGGYPGMGLVCGQVSGGLELLELEGAAVDAGLLDQLQHLAQRANLGELLDRVTAGYTEVTPGGGLHFLYRVTGAPVPGNTKLASRAGDIDGTLTTLIETRGEGGFVIVAPSGGTTHPTGGEWRLTAGGVATIATITADEHQALHQLCRALDATPQPAPRAPAGPRHLRSVDSVGDRPGDRYEAQTSWSEVLEPHEWVHVFTSAAGVGHWRRPGKGTGISATTNSTGADTLKVHTTSTMFSTDGTYSRFGAMALLDHGGDHQAAARAARQQLEFDQPSPSTSTRGPHPAEADSPGAAGVGGGGPAAPPPGAGGPTIGDREAVIVTGRPLEAITGDILAILTDANDPPVVFIRGGDPTRVRVDENHRPIVEPMGVHQVRHRIHRTMRPLRRSKGGDISDVVCPLDVVNDVLAHDQLPFPPLTAVVETPTLRPDGTIHHAPGYDPATRLLHIPASNLTVPPVPDQPPGDEVAAARTLLVDNLLTDFPFDTGTDLANAVGLLLTPTIRPAISGQVPLALVDAPEPGTGKGLLANVVAILATGRPAAARPLSNADEEVRKMLTATLLEAPSVIVLDNIEEALKSPSLAGVLTTDEWTDRRLGSSETVAVPNRATWIATGNSLRVAGDLARRCYRIRLDAHQAKPHTRTGFRHPDLITWTQEHRAPLIHALLTVARAWYAAGQPAAPDTPVLGGFTPWVATCAGILHHAGISGFLANLGDLQADVDTEAQEWEAFLAGIRAIYLDRRRFTVANLVARLQDPHSSEGVDLRQLVPAILADHIDKTGFSKRLALAFTKREGRRHGDEELAVLKVGKNRDKVLEWVVEALTVPSAGSQLPAATSTTRAASDANEQVSGGAAGSAGSAGSSSNYAGEESPEIPSADGAENYPQLPALPAPNDERPDLTHTYDEPF